MKNAWSTASLSPRSVETESFFWALRNRGYLRQAADIDELLIQYLLGELSEEEQEGVEQRFISDPEFYKQLLTVEDDLIDAYTEGELSQSRRTSFENHFLRSPDRHARVGFAKAFMVYVSRKADATRPITESARRRPLFGFLRFESWPVPLRVAAVVLVILAGAWLATESLRLRNRVQQGELQRAALERKQRELEQQMDEERRHSQELSAQLERERNERDQQTPGQTVPDQVRSGIVSFLLTPGLVRGTGEAQKRIIPPGAGQVSLQLNFKEGDYESYVVVISTVVGREVWRKAGLKPQSRNGGKFVVVQVPAGVFATDDYIVTLSGTGSTEKVAQYFFSAARK